MTWIQNRSGKENGKERQYDLLAVGTVLVDTIIRGFDPVPVSRTGYRAQSCSLNPGGEALNEAIAAAKLGLRTAVLGYTGPDAAGNLIRDTLKHAGVDIRYLMEQPDQNTPVTTMFVAEDGSRKSITNTAHRYNFHPERHLKPIRNTRAVVLGSLFRAPFDDPKILLAVLRFAKEAGVITVADTKLPNFRKLTLPDFRESLPLIDYITPNEDEAACFTGKNDPESMADVFLDYGVKNVILKLGAKGCLLKNASQVIRLPAEQIQAVDATGAGDNFVAGFLCEILNGEPMERALRFANVCGAICTTMVGAGTALLSREQVLEFLNQKEL